jgi:hypothetical protein
MSSPNPPEIVKFCACGCGEPMTNRRANAKYWSDACRKRGHDFSRVRIRPFVALDGEGEEHPTKGHIYNLLASGDGKDIASKQGLDTERCLEFLLDLPRGSNSGRKPIYVWFAMDYDINMILADLPLKGENSIATLRATNQVIWRGYRIFYIRRKIFRISFGKRRHTSYDVWGFFQSTFENACENWNVEIPSIIAEGKSSRGGFSRWTLNRIRAYNAAELVALEELTEKLRDSITPLDLPIQSWHGPAALAASWLRKNKVKEWLIPKELPERLQEVTSRAYFGGRIDVLGYGIVDPVYHYDIVSAYPAAMADLPDLSKLEWVRRGRKPDRGRLYTARIRWQIPAGYWAPFPWRANNGSIRYPLQGEGWYWKPEIETAIAKYGEKYFQILDSWVAEGIYEYPFHSLIHNTFKYRGELKAQNHPSATAVKLILNSLYGKFAQTVGKATYYSPIWAGIITSQTRAKLLSVLTDDVVCVMTDSIWSRKPLDVPIGVGLGDWEQQDETRLVLAEAGLYQAFTPDGESNIWQRGFDKRHPVDIEYIVDNWLGIDPTYTPHYKVLRFVGMGLASVTSYPWRQWVEIDRKVEPVPLVGTTKRQPFFPDRKGELRKGFICLFPRDRDTDTISAPYSKITFDEELMRVRLEEECSEV